MKPATVYDLLVITGPTASGKTSLAAAVAYETGGEIISADSRQVYRRMNLGTGKDYEDYSCAGKSIPFHLIDIAEPGTRYNLFEYISDFRKVYTGLKNRNIFPVLCGGSGMYVDSIVSGYRIIEVPPDAGLRNRLETKSMDELKGILLSYREPHNVTDFDTKKRIIRAIEIEEYSRQHQDLYNGMPRMNSLVIGILTDRETRRRRISERLKSRIEAGMIDEVRQLIAEGIAPDDLIYYGLEYKYITLYLINRISYNEMMGSLEVAIHQFAKRQMTWFRGMERRGVKINWIEGSLPLEKKAAMIIDLLSI